MIDSVINWENAVLGSRVFADYARRMSLIHRTSIEAVLAAQDALSRDRHRVAPITEEYPNRQTSCGRIEEVLEDNTSSITAGSPTREQWSPEPADAENEKITPIVRPSRANRSIRKKSSGGRNDWLQLVGISGALVCSWDQHQSTYIFALRSRLPAIFGRRALIFELALRQYALSWTNLSFLYGSIGVPVVVPCSSEIFEACKIGDEAAVRKLIESRQASPNDRQGKCCCSDSRHERRFQEDEIPLFVSALFD